MTDGLDKVFASHNHWKQLNLLSTACDENFQKLNAFFCGDHNTFSQKSLKHT